MNDAVLFACEGPVATLTLNRPAAMNALNPAMAEGLATALNAAEGHAGLRALVVRGAGDAFMAGGDVRYFGDLLEKPDAMPIRGLIDMVHALILRLAALPCPVIAAVHGPCAGFGISLMAACDLAVARDDAVFTLAYTQIGISPDGGSTWALPRLVGLRRAMALTLLSERIGASDAVAMGLVSQAVPADAFEAAVAKLAGRLAAGPTLAYARAKALLRASFDRTLPEQLEAEADAFAAGAASKDFREGVTAFLQKRKPAFTGE